MRNCTTANPTDADLGEAKKKIRNAVNNIDKSKMRELKETIKAQHQRVEKIAFKKSDFEDIFLDGYSDFAMFEGFWDVLHEYDGTDIDDELSDWSLETLIKEIWKS